MNGTIYGKGQVLESTIYPCWRFEVKEASEEGYSGSILRADGTRIKAYYPKERFDTLWGTKAEIDFAKANETKERLYCQQKQHVYYYHNASKWWADFEGKHYEAANEAKLLEPIKKIMEANAKRMKEEGTYDAL